MEAKQAKGRVITNYKYLQLAELLRNKILEGDYRPGERIPTEPELSNLFSSSRHAVRKAVSVLEEEGYLNRIQGSGTYVTENFRRPPLEGSGHSNIIGLIIGNSQTYLSPEIIRGASDYLIEQGYLPSVAMTSGSYASEKKALEILLKNRPAGILLEPVNSGLFSVNYELYQQINEEAPCLLLHSGNIGACRALSLHDRMGAQLLTEYLLSLGHTKIGVILCIEEYTGQKRYCGFLSTLRSHGLSHNQEHCIWTQRSRIDDLFEPGGSLELDRMLETVTAVFCHDDRVAYALIRYLENKGICVPDDISVVGYDDSIYAQLSLPITTVSHPKAEYGLHAAQALLDMIHSPQTANLSKYESQPELIIRDSTAPSPESSH